MTIYLIFPILVGTWFFTIGALVFLKNKKAAVNRTFTLLSLSCTIWLYGYVFAYVAPDPTVAFKIIKFLYVGVIFIPTFFYHFAIEFLHWFIQKPKKRREILPPYILSAIFLILLFTTDHFIVGVYDYHWGYYAKGGIIHSLFLVFFPIVWMGGVFNLYIAYKKIAKESPSTSNAIKYLFLGFLLGSPGMLDFIQNYGVELYPFGSIFVGIGVSIIAYTLIRHHLLDINLVITRAGIFAFVYAAVLGIPFGVGALVKEPLSQAAPHWWWLLPMFLLVVSASIAPFIYMKLQRRVESRLRAEEFESHEALRRLSHNMLRFTNLEGLLKLIVHQLVKILKLKFAAIYLFDAKRDRYILKNYWRPAQSLDSVFDPIREFTRDTPLIKDLYMRRLPIVTEEVKLFAPKGMSPHVKELLSTLSHLKANTVIPSFLRNNLIGFVILSSRRTNAAFTQDDLNLLMVLSNEVALAIENAQFHQKEKMVLVEKSRREALADMAPGASHQFNNRLVAISSSAELLLMKLEGVKMDKVNDEKVKTVLKDVKSTLELIDQEVYKGKEITSAILKRAKAKVDFQKVDIKSLVENAYRLVLISHSHSGMGGFKEPKFKIDVLNELPAIFGSEALLQDCFYNLIDNAFDAIRDALKEKPEVMSRGEVVASIKREGSTIIAQVKDNGIGLTKENQKKLFTPYFTTKATSNKGSGLGLYVIRDFIEMHGGSIRCESEYGKGTSFIIKLPIERRRKKREA